jgi:threonine/homoserine/homoserine lactone efflux protein
VTKFLRLLAVVVGWDTFVVLSNHVQNGAGIGPSALVGLVSGGLIWRIAGLFAK